MIAQVKWHNLRPMRLTVMAETVHAMRADAMVNGRFVCLTACGLQGTLDIQDQQLSGKHHCLPCKEIYQSNKWGNDDWHRE